MNAIVGVGSVGASDQFCDKVEVFVPVTEVVTEVFVIVGEAIGVGSVGESDQFSDQVVVFGPVSVVVTVDSVVLVEANHHRYQIHLLLQPWQICFL